MNPETNPCPKCGAEIPANQHRFCPRCGHRIVQDHGMSKVANLWQACCFGIFGILIAASGTCAVIVTASGTNRGQERLAWGVVIAGVILAIGALIAFVREVLK